MLEDPQAERDEAHLLVDTLRHLKYRAGLGAASPSCLPIMTYAVIRTGGKQYRVSPGAMLRIERLDGDVGAAVEFPEVLLAGSQPVGAAASAAPKPIQV